MRHNFIFRRGIWNYVALTGLRYIEIIGKIGLTPNPKLCLPYRAMNNTGYIYLKGGTVTRLVCRTSARDDRHESDSEDSIHVVFLTFFPEMLSDLFFLRIFAASTLKKR